MIKNFDRNKEYALGTQTTLLAWRNFKAELIEKVKRCANSRLPKGIYYEIKREIVKPKLHEFSSGVKWLPTWVIIYWYYGKSVKQSHIIHKRPKKCGNNQVILGRFMSAGETHTCAGGKR